MTATGLANWEQVRDLLREINRLDGLPHTTVTWPEIIENTTDFLGRPEPELMADDEAAVEWYGVALASFESEMGARGESTR